MKMPSKWIRYAAWKEKTSIRRNSEDFLRIFIEIKQQQKNTKHASQKSLLFTTLFFVKKISFENFVSRFVTDRAHVNKTSSQK